MTCGEKGADFGSGRGPWTVQVSLSPEVESDARPGAVEFGFLEASSSRYADPEAEGVTPVFKNIFLSTFGGLVLVGLSGISLESFVR